MMSFHSNNLKKLKDIGDAVKNVSKFVAPKELAKRWQCSRSSVDRIAARVGLSRVFLGEGKNGLVRYIRAEVESYEASRLVKGSAVL